jgi:raffinose/stachyose/melibiose transport system permease protein
VTRQTKAARTLPLHTVLVAVGVVMLAPLVYAALSGFKSTDELSRNPFGLPEHWLTGNYTDILRSSDF